MDFRPSSTDDSDPSGTAVLAACTRCKRSENYREEREEERREGGREGRRSGSEGRGGEGRGEDGKGEHLLLGLGCAMLV
jgi:hypothetical protein